MGALFGNFRRLAQFSGRERRESFWPYAGLVIGLSVIIMIAATLPEMLASVERMEEFVRANPDQGSISSGPGHYSVTVQGHHPELMPDMSLMMGITAVSIAAACILLAAAVCRRLHDTGRRGWWGTLPLPFIVFSTVKMPQFFAASEPDFSDFGLLFLNNALYLLALLALAILLALPSQPTENRFGPPYIT